LANFDDQFATAKFGSRENRQSALSHETANDAVIVARRATVVVAAFARARAMVRVLVRGAVLDCAGGARFARMAMPQPAKRAGQHVANR
jgi:hypothetical protein